MNRSVGLMAFTFLLLLARQGHAQQCGYPWTVTATQAGAQTVAVNLCGSWIGCQPHDPQFTVLGNQIRVTMTAGEGTSGCQCIPVETSPNLTVLVRPVPSGAYVVTAVVLDCGQPVTVGTTSVSVGTASAIPTLDWYGLVAFGIMLFSVGLWRIRT